jgi:hypothetical protein
MINSKTFHAWKHDNIRKGFGELIVQNLPREIVLETSETPV